MWAMPLSSTALPTKFSDAVFWFLLSFPWGQRQYFPLSPSVICSHPTNPFSPPAPAVNVYPSLLPPSKTQVGLASCIEYIIMILNGHYWTVTFPKLHDLIRFIPLHVIIASSLLNIASDLPHLTSCNNKLNSIVSHTFILTEIVFSHLKYRED